MSAFPISFGFGGGPANSTSGINASGQLNNEQPIVIIGNQSADSLDALGRLYQTVGNANNKIASTWVPVAEKAVENSLPVGGVKVPSNSSDISSYLIVGGVIVTGIIIFALLS